MKMPKMPSMNSVTNTVTTTLGQAKSTVTTTLGQAKSKLNNLRGTTNQANQGENKGIFIDPKKLSQESKRMNILYLYTNADLCQSPINLWSYGDKGKGLKGRYAMNVSAALEDLPMLHMADSHDLTGDVTNKGISAFPFMYLGNKGENPEHTTKRKILEKCPGYRLKRSTEHKNYWILEGNSRGTWERLEDIHQTYEHLQHIIYERLKNPVLHYANTAAEDLVIVIDTTPTIINRNTLGPHPDDTITEGELITITKQNSNTKQNPNVQKLVKKWPEDKDEEIPKNARLWIEGALYNDDDKVYLRPRPRPKVEKEIERIKEETEQFAQVMTAQKATPEQVDKMRKKYANDIKNLKETNPANSFYLWTGEAQFKGGSRKSIRKHKGIHQIGGKAGKLKKGYKYSGKTMKNGKPQIIKVKSKKQISKVKSKSQIIKIKSN
jgi:hypothetical protein